MPSPLPSPPAPPAIPTGQELFDALMGHIEPELVSSQTKTLEKTYKDETPAEHATRMKRYDLAFERYDTAYREYMATLEAQVGRYRRSALEHAELRDRAEDEPVLGNFDVLFQQAA